LDLKSIRAVKCEKAAHPQLHPSVLFAQEQELGKTEDVCISRIEGNPGHGEEKKRCMPFFALHMIDVGPQSEPLYEPGPRTKIDELLCSGALICSK
jgi:hypothetical protein